MPGVVTLPRRLARFALPPAVAPRGPVMRGPVMRGPAAPGRRIAVAAAALTATVLAAGCSAGPPGAPRGSVAACYAFAVQALGRHVTVTSVPPACRGLNHEQINLAVARAIRTAAGPHRKVIARRLAHREAAYLAYLVTVVPPRGPAPPAAAPSGPSTGSPLRLAALVAWLITVAAGTWLLAGWLARGGLSRDYIQVAGVPRPVIAGHFTLALAGLGIWAGFLATGLPALAWAAVAVALTVAGLGMATLAGGLPEGHPAGAVLPEALRREPQLQPALQPLEGQPSPGQPSPGQLSPGQLSPGGPLEGRPSPGQPRATEGPPPAGRAVAIGVPAGKPLARIALHGALAAVTILLVVLAAIGAH